MQRTIGKTVKLNGIGVHSGLAAKIEISSAPSNSGIRFVRVDLPEGENLIDARFDSVTQTALCTVIGNAHGATVSTIEHLMAALAGFGIDNALIEIDGPEMPILDGSASDFVEPLSKAGTITQDEPLQAIRILKTVTVEHEGKRASLTPCGAFEIDFAIDFADPAIGRQSRSAVMVGDAFLRHYARARTFCSLGEVEMLREKGFARGGSMNNAIVVDRGRVLNRGGLRYSDEFVRHKMLDALGDLALAGAPIIGRYEGYKSGHDMTNRLLHALFERGDAWCFEQVEDRGMVAPDYQTRSRELRLAS